LVSVPPRRSQANFSFGDSIKALLLQPGLPFASVLSEQHIKNVLAKHGCTMNGVYSTAIVLWAFMSQNMRDGKEAACQSAVARISSFFTLRGKPAPGADTGNYCRAIAKLPEDTLKELCLGVAS